jgi:lipopolysaccharide transport system ATP-binding protein
MNPENAVEIEDVWKSFRTGAIRGQTLMRELESTFARLRGKADPNTKIVQRDQLTSDSAQKNQRFWAVRGTSFSVKKGEVVAVLGRNGAGKSTLLQIICRITEADRGVVRLRGRIASLLGAGVGFHEEMTGRENVFLNGSILGMTPSQIEDKMDAIAQFAEIPNFLDTPVKRYSNGMRSRLGFSVAVHLDCDIMILDEVFAAGDKVFRNKCIEKMKELARSGRTILIVIHFPEMLKEVCHRGVVMKEGSVIFDGDIEPAIDIYMAS